MQALDLARERGMEDALQLSTRDVEWALEAMRRQLLLRRVRRCLLHDALDGRTARALADLALRLQDSA
jgi:hypothetical protein